MGLTSHEPAKLRGMLLGQKLRDDGRSISSSQSMDSSPPLYEPKNELGGNDVLFTLIETSCSLGIHPVVSALRRTLSDVRLFNESASWSAIEKDFLRRNTGLGGGAGANSTSKGLFNSFLGMGDPHDVGMGEPHDGVGVSWSSWSRCVWVGVDGSSWSR